MGKNEQTIRLCAAGDVALGGSLEGRLDSAAVRRAFIEEVQPLFAGSDICFLDLDCTFDTRGDPPHPDEYLVAASAGQLQLLRDLGIDIVSQANNHSLDYGGESLASSRRHLEELGIATVGAGSGLAEARRPHIIERKGVRVGFLGYASTHPWVGAVPAARGTAGVAPLDPEMIHQDVVALRDRVDFLAVSLHWGKEYLPYPPPENVELGHRLIDWGVDLVIGHHPHVIQGIERYRQGIICYSLGNFLFPDYPEQELAFRAEKRESLVLTFALSPTGVELEQMAPVTMEDGGRLRLLTGEEMRQLADNVAEYTTAVGRTDYPDLWQRKVRDYELRRLWRVFDQEVIQAGWKGGANRLLSLGIKNFRSVGRSLVEIFTGAKKN